MGGIKKLAISTYNKVSTEYRIWYRSSDPAILGHRCL